MLVGQRRGRSTNFTKSTSGLAFWSSSIARNPPVTVLTIRDNPPSSHPLCRRCHWPMTAALRTWNRPIFAIAIGPVSCDSTRPFPHPHSHPFCRPPSPTQLPRVQHRGASIQSLIHLPSRMHGQPWTSSFSQIIVAAPRRASPAKPRMIKSPPVNQQDHLMSLSCRRRCPRSIATKAAAARHCQSPFGVRDGTRWSPCRPRSSKHCRATQSFWVTKGSVLLLIIKHTLDLPRDPTTSNSTHNRPASNVREGTPVTVIVISHSDCAKRSRVSTICKAKRTPEAGQSPLKPTYCHPQLQVGPPFALLACLEDFSSWNNFYFRILPLEMAYVAQ